MLRCVGSSCECAQWTTWEQGCQEQCTSQGHGAGQAVSRRAWCWLGQEDAGVGLEETATLAATGDTRRWHVCVAQYMHLAPPHTHAPSPCSWCTRQLTPMCFWHWQRRQTYMLGLLLLHRVDKVVCGGLNQRQHATITRRLCSFFDTSFFNHYAAPCAPYHYHSNQTLLPRHRPPRHPLRSLPLHRRLRHPPCRQPPGQRQSGTG